MLPPIPWAAAVARPQAAFGCGLPDPTLGPWAGHGVALKVRRHPRTVVGRLGRVPVLRDLNCSGSLLGAAPADLVPGARSPQFLACRPAGAPSALGERQRHRQRRRSPTALLADRRSGCPGRYPSPAIAVDRARAYCLATAVPGPDARISDLSPVWWPIRASSWVGVVAFSAGTAATGAS